MLKESDLIKQGVEKILGMACNDPERKVKAIVIAQEMVAKAVGMRRNPAPRKLTLKQSLPKAVALYNLQDRKQWIAEKMELYDDQIQFTESIAIWYTTVMSSLTPLQAKVLEQVLRSYHKGVVGGDIARLCSEDRNVTTSILSRMVKAGIVQSRKNEKNRRQSIYYVPDVNWLRVHALKHNGAFRKWLEKEPSTASGEDIIDRFISWFTETKYGTEGVD